MTSPTDLKFLIKWLALIGAQQNSETAVFELRHALLHIQHAENLTGNKFPLNYKDLRTIIRQNIAIIQTNLETPEDQK